MSSAWVTKVVAMSSILTGILVAAVSSWVLHKSMQAVKNPTKTTAEDLLYQVNTFFGGTTGLYDLDVIFHILIYCSATALFGGLLQFLMSFWLLMMSVGGGREGRLAWIMTNIFILVAIGGSFLCIMTNELQISTPLYFFLPVTGIDALLLILFSWLVFAASRGDDVDESDESDEEVDQRIRRSQRIFTTPSASGVIRSGPGPGSVGVGVGVGTCTGSGDDRSPLKKTPIFTSRREFAKAAEATRQPPMQTVI